ncbi:MAG TPA: macro domain-containing protein [Ignavibacteria bacterium]|nr:macro domain-containing protein [Ignavibacteria bacterium]
MSIKIGNTELEVVKGDITLLEVEAIVNPANTFLMHTGGLAAAIVKRGGMIIQQESKKIGNVPVGSAVVTKGGSLKAEHVIHAVGPRYKDGKSGEPEKLASAVNAALNVADKKKLKSIAIPAISSGIFGYPIADSSRIIVETAKEFFETKKKEKQETTIEKVVFCLLDDEAFEAFNNILENPSKRNKK